MKTEKLVTVVIPVYKEEINKEELISLRQCVNVLSNHHIVLVSPEGLSLNRYFSEYQSFEVESFEKGYFDNIQGYNKLMLSSEFYKRFINSRFILLYQLDAYVFKDDLNFWCAQGYDYIGAPWFEGWHESSLKSELIGVGNGGLSLRRVANFLNQFKMLKRLKLIEKYGTLTWKETLLKLPNLFNDLIKYNKMKLETSLIIGQEDYFWCIDMETHYGKYEQNKSFIKLLFKRFPIKRLSIADTNSAFKFSFECQPARLYELNNKVLPFGCHAWYKYDYEFWKTFISADGYDLP